MATYLTPGYKNHNELHEEYTICKVLGRGASTIAYLADYVAPGKMPAKRVVKEYCPAHMDIARLEDGSLQVNAGSKQHFDEGLHNFEFGSNRQNEIRSIDALANMTPAIQSIFRANNTVYQDVMPFIGETFDNNQGLSLLERIRICLSIAKLVKRYHEAGYLCLDIKPNNIMVLDTTALSQDVVNFIDFDSIRKKNEVTFGKSLSFTEHWAAPEQTNPYKFAQISERTDIYTIGELVFWSVFDRHSTEKEHRSFSRYPFENSGNKFTADLMRIPLQKWLSTLFANTIRASTRNRYSSVDAVIKCLEGAVAELSKTEHILSAVTAKPFFVGRSKEIEAIGEALKCNTIVFVSGIAGIGKSELVRQYAVRSKERYDNMLFWAFDGDLNHTIANDTAVAITGLAQIPEESDAAYSHRKLRKLKELMHGGDNLIILDNLNLSVDEISQQETWNLLCSLPGKLLITTRNIEQNYACIPVKEIGDSDQLKQLFMEYCAYDVEDEPYVERIVSNVDGHTLLVELLAKQTAAKHISPRDAHEQLNIYDTQSYTGETVRVLKDDHTSNETVYAHIQRLFSLDALAHEQTLLLGQLALLPVSGYDCKKTMAFYAIDNANDLNWLNEHGWITINPESRIVSIHPMIATVAMGSIQNDDLFTQELYRKCTDSILKRKTNSISEADHVALSDAIAHATANRYSPRGRDVAIFLTRYVGSFSRYGNLASKLDLTNIALAIFDACIPADRYSAVREEAYHLRANFLYSLKQPNKAVEICDDHLNKAKKAHDWYFAAQWIALRSSLCFGAFSNSVRRYFQGIIGYFQIAYYGDRIDRDLQKKHPRFFSEERLLGDLDYDYIAKSRRRFSASLLLMGASLLESQVSPDLFATKGCRSSINPWKSALGLREKVHSKMFKTRSNQEQMLINRAAISFLSGDYFTARSHLQKILDYYDDHHLTETSNSYRVHHFLGHIELRSGNTQIAVAEFQKCLQIHDEIQGTSNLAVRAELGYQLNVGEKWDESFTVNHSLYVETKKMDSEVRGPYYADALRNLGVLYYHLEHCETGRKMLLLALQEYGKANASMDVCFLGKARTYQALAILDRSSRPEPDECKQIQERFENAIDYYKQSVGLSHPEAVTCIAQYDQIKTQ